MGFAKLDHNILQSSIWDEPASTRVVWITMLAAKDENGFVACSRSGLRRMANVTDAELDAALMCLESPDDDSRTPDNDGRRVDRIEGGWVVLNHKKYRDHSEVSREKTRERVRRYREKLSSGKDNVTLQGVTGVLPSVSVSVSESVFASAVKGGGVGEGVETWKTSYPIYKSEHDAAYARLSVDLPWLAEQERLNPGINAGLSLEKAARFWGREEGWRHKKRKRTVKLNWTTTYETALSMPGNKVYRPRTTESPGRVVEDNHYRQVN